jgi:hypothetical protein
MLHECIWIRFFVSCFSFRWDKNDPRSHTNKTLRFVCFRGSSYPAKEVLKKRDAIDSTDQRNEI